MKVGQCIYCGTTEVPLTREHIMPRVLGGNVPPPGMDHALVLGAASCSACQRITQHIEDSCLNSALGPARMRLGLKRKDRDAGTAKVMIERLDGSRAEEELGYEHLPGALVIPAYRSAAPFLPEDVWIGPDYKFIITEPARFPSSDIRRVGVSAKVHAGLFAKMLAKIGLGIAVYRLGMNGFAPTVRRLILDENEDYRFHVGGFCDEIPNPEKTDKLHACSLHHHDGAVIVNIQLFQEFGGPANYVIVGRELI